MYYSITLHYDTNDKHTAMHITCRGKSEPKTVGTEHQLIIIIIIKNECHSNIIAYQLVISAYQLDQLRLMAQSLSSQKDLGLAITLNLEPSSWIK